MIDEYAISLQQACKYYTLYAQAHHRLFEVITGKAHHKTVKALKPISLNVPHGQVLGLIGGNGAGKSTLLKLITGTVAITKGELSVNGHVVALLELGAGFHPDLSGHENIFLYASIIGIKKEVIKQQYDNIVEFSGLEDFIHNPVKTYSSGMFIRLAFSVATCVDPDILIIDEALSVGDGSFAHKSFKRIMEFKEKGKTIIFCTHSMYHISAICDRALWIDKGNVIMDDLPSKVVPAYNASMNTENTSTSEKITANQQTEQNEPAEQKEITAKQKEITAKPQAKESNKALAYFTAIDVSVDGNSSSPFIVSSCESTLKIQASFYSDSSVSIPHFAISIENEQNYKICSASTSFVNFSVKRNHKGISSVVIEFNKIALLNGIYSIFAYLICDKGLHLFEEANIASLEVMQKGLDLGVVHLDYQCKSISA
jgi:lipopolysaccharide transport system ATP-binding protein